MLPGDRLHEPGPVALHLAPLLGGRRDERPSSRTGWLGRYLDRDRHARQPAAGPLARLRASSRRSRPRRCRSPRSTGPTATTFWARNVWGDVESRMLDAIGALGAAADRAATRRSARSTSAARQSASPAPAAARRSRPRTTARLHEPGRRTRRATTSSRAGSPASRRCSPPACRSAVVGAQRARACTTRTPTSRRSSPTALKLTADSLLAFQRDLEARGLADRVLVHVWSEFGRRARRTARTGPTTARPAPGFLIGSRVQRDDDRRVPGPRRSSTSRATCARRPTSAASTARCSSSGSARTPTAIIPGARKFAPAEARQVIATALVLLTLAAPAPARVQVGADEFGYTLSRADDQGGAGDRAARQLRRGRARPAPPSDRRHAGRTGSARCAPAASASSRRASFPAVSGSGARSPITARAA